MRVGVDASCWSNRRGYGRFARELIPELLRAAPELGWIFFLDEATAADFDPGPGDFRMVMVPQQVSPSRAAAAQGFRSPSDMSRFTRSVWATKPDVFFCPSVYTYFPLPLGLPAVVAVHDVIAERFPRLTLPSRRDRLFWRAKVWLALKQARLVLTVSEYSAREIGRVLRVGAQRIRLAGEAPARLYQPSEQTEDPVRVAAAMGVPRGASWFMYVGGFNPHKRLDSVVRAHASVVEECAPENRPYLLLVGTRSGDVFHSEVRVIEQLIERLGTGAYVVWPGFVPDELLRHLYSGALALVLASEAEGFGLPAVEAAACGTPVIATTESPLPDLLAGGGFFIQPGDVASIASAMRTLRTQHEMRREMGAIGCERASRLSWRESAHATVAALREAAA